MEPTLRLVPLSAIQLQEEADAQRLIGLITGMKKSRVVRDPPVVTNGLGKKLIQLDGTTRISALKALGCSHAIVQYVNYTNIDEVLLKSWVHVSRVNQSVFRKRIHQLMNAEVEEFKLGLGLRLSGHPLTAVTIVFRDGTGLSVRGDMNLFKKVRMMKRVVNLYSELITRNREVSIESMEQLGDFFQNHIDKNVALFFPTFSAYDIYELMKKHETLPQGVTRHIVYGRVLGLDYPWQMLLSSVSEKEKQKFFKTFMTQVHFRYYEESVNIVE